jgi:hypothetical protein
MIGIKIAGRRNLKRAKKIIAESDAAFLCYIAQI